MENYSKLSNHEKDMESIKHSINKSKQLWNKLDTTNLINWIFDEKVHDQDTKATIKLLNRVLDMAAGIGRVTKYMLSK